ncbi:MAG TPA: TIR domain-containing protein [Anaerolineales bacterium]|nr:TIR domain-containing protein [Anaerolineales bacterium]
MEDIMARVFVSYSRKNIDFAKRLIEKLQEREMDFWVDWEGIPPTVDWMREIEKGIEEADAFLAIVSAEWIASKVCKDELAIAVKNGKRLIPVVPLDVVWNDVPSALAHLNFLFFTQNFDFDQQLQRLIAALDTDYDWLKTHRRLQVKALEWERSNNDTGFLLRGRDLEDAEQQLSINANKDPRPTDLQRGYVLKSRQGATRQRRLTTGILIGLIIGMLGTIALLARPYVEEAIAKSQAQKLSRMILVPVGSLNFQLGENFQTIEIPAFSIEMTPVSNKVYGLCVKVDKCTPPIGSTAFIDSSQADDPVVWITITQAATYCEWIGRRLPSAPEWEQAAQLFAKFERNKDRFTAANIYEWVSSYVDENSQFISGQWSGHLDQLDRDWVFLQERGNLNSAGTLELETSESGPLGTHSLVGFRCAK